MCEWKRQEKNLDLYPYQVFFIIYIIIYYMQENHNTA